MIGENLKFFYNVKLDQKQFLDMHLNISYFWIGLGGAIGAIARVAMTAWLPSSIFNFPLTILCINAIGCFFAGVAVEFMAFYWNASANARHFLIQGLLGGFTTFSAFAIEFGVLYGKGSHYLAVLYAILSVTISIFFFFGGLRLIRFFIS